MGEHLTKFQSQTRIKADPELIRRWEFDARFDGNRNIKNQLATAKRTATSLEKASKQFSQLRPEHELAINAATSALRALVAELTPLAAWAKDYKVFCDEQDKKARAADLDEIAKKRWGNNDSALLFELELMKELGTPEGQVAFGKWAHSVGKYNDVDVKQISCTVDRFDVSDEQKTPRARAAHAVKNGIRTTPQRWTGLRGETVISSWEDYEAYLSYRKDVARTTARIVQMANEQP